MLKKSDIKEILYSHLFSFVEEKILKEVIDDLEVLFFNELWEIGADIMKKAGVKQIKTSYKQPK